MADDFLRRNALRLLRENWDSPSALAQELYTILADQPTAGISARSRVAEARQEEATGRSSVSMPPEPDRRPPPATYRQSQTGRSPVEPIIQQIQSRLERVRDPDHLPGIVLAHSILPPGGVVYVPASMPQPWPAITFASPSAPPSPPRREDEADREEASASGMSPAVVPRVALSSQGSPPSPSRTRIPSGDLVLPAPAHVAFAVPPTDTAYGYAPLGLPGAYSGQERTAGDYNPVEGPVYRELRPDDPFARKYYDLRFFLPDWDSPRPTGGGGSTTLIGQVVSSGPSPVEVMLYPNGPDADPSPPGSVSVTILQIADDEVVPADTWITGILKAGDDYYAQIPVWLADAGDGGSS